MKPRAVLVLSAVLAFALLLWLVLGGGPPASGTLDVADPTAPEDDVTLRAAESLPGDAPKDGAPALRLDADRPQGEAGRGVVRVQVVGFGGYPIPRAQVRAGTAWERTTDLQAVLADDEGRAVLRDIPYDGTWFVTTGFGVESNDPKRVEEDPDDPWLPTAPVAGLPRAPGHAEPWTWVRGPDVTLRVGTGRRVSVHVVDAHTGRHVLGARARWRGDRLHPHTAVPATPAVFHIVSTEAFPLLPHHLELDVPRGHVAWDERAFQGPPCVYARELSVVYPLRPAQRATIVAKHADGRAARAVLDHAEVAGRSGRLQVARDGSGNLQIDGLPFYRHEPFRFSVRDADSGAIGGIVGRLPGEPGALPVLWVALDPGPVIRDEDIEDHLETDNDLPYEQSLGTGAVKPPPRRQLHVRVLRRDGTPAVGARVSFIPHLEEHESPMGPRKATTDLEGIARFADPRPGTATVAADQLGFLDVQGTVEVRALGVTEARVQERAGGRLTVEIIDEHGRGLSFATCQLQTGCSHPYVDMQDGIQRMDRFTDHEGRRTYAGVFPGPVTLYVQWGHRRKNVEAKIAAGRTEVVRVVLPSGRK